jgi:hypothetical protein
VAFIRKKARSQKCANHCPETWHFQSDFDSGIERGSSCHLHERSAERGIVRGRTPHHSLRVSGYSSVNARQRLLFRQIKNRRTFHRFALEGQRLKRQQHSKGPGGVVGYRFNCMVTYNPKPHTLFLVPKLNIPAREFSMVQRELEGALARLGDCREPRRRVPDFAGIASLDRRG